jgi:hypothetical protein
MTSTFRSLAVLAVVCLFAASVSADDAKIAASPAVYAKSSTTVLVRLAAWPGYNSYYSGAYYGTFRWRYQPYYTYYNPPVYGYGYPALAPVFPGYGYGYYYTWPQYGAFGYTYYGPGLSTGW